MEGYIAEIRMFAANFAPRNWAYCQGQILSIASNTALFSLLGTTYGGNGQTTFGLPNFASRVALGTGQGQGLSIVQLGEMSGVEGVVLNLNQIPSHTHTATGNVTPGAYNGGGDESNPTSGYPSNSTTGTGNLFTNVATGSMGATPANVTIYPNGNNTPHNNIQPSLGMNYIICMFGIFPSRN